jgi:type IV pilus assembly protein PilM
MAQTFSLFQHQPAHSCLHIEDADAYAVTFEKKKGARSWLRALARCPIPDGAISHGLIQDEKKVADAIRTLVSHGIKHRFPKYVLVTLPDEQTYVLMVTLAKKDLTDVGESLRWETAQHVPLSVEEIVLDWFIVEETKEQVTFQVAVASRSLVEAYARTCEHAGCIPVGFEIASFATLRSLSYQSTGASIVLSFGKSSTTCILAIEKGILLALSTPIFSGNRSIELLQHQLKLQPEEAEKALEICGLDPTMSQGVVRKALWGEFRSLLSYVERCRLFLAQTHPQISCTTIVMTGRYSNMLHLSEELAQQTTLKLYSSPLRHIDISGLGTAAKIPTNMLTSFGIAFGLALSHV